MSGPGPQDWGPPQQQGWGPQQQQQQQQQGWGPTGQAPAAPQGSGQIAIPRWLPTDWALAAQIALIGQAILIAVGIVLSLLGGLRVVSVRGLDAVDWPAVAVRPLLEVLGWSGAGAGEPLLVTGVLYAFLAYRYVARRHPVTLHQMSSDRARLLAAAGKVGIIAAMFLLVVGILLNSFAQDLVGRANGVALQGRIDFTALVFFSVFVGSTAALFAVLSAARSTLLGFLGITARGSTMLRSGANGARRTLIAGGASMLVLATLGRLLDSFSGTSGLGQVLGTLIGTIEGLVVLWLDWAVLLLLGASKFLHDGGYLWFTTSTAPAWMWVAIPVLAAAFIVGGIVAAKAAQPRTQAEAVKAAVLVGPFVSVVSLLVAIGWAGQPNIDDIVPIALILPTLWGSLALVGAWAWANQQGMVSGFVIGDGSAAQQTAPAGWGPPGSEMPQQQAPPQQTPPQQTPQAGWGPPANETPPQQTPPQQTPQAGWGPPANEAPQQQTPQAGWGPPANEAPQQQTPPQAIPPTQSTGWDSPHGAEPTQAAASQPWPSSTGLGDQQQAPDAAQAAAGWLPPDDDDDLDSLPPPSGPPGR